jgi:hypothetical protein
MGYAEMRDAQVRAELGGGLQREASRTNSGWMA